MRRRRIELAGLVNLAGSIAGKQLEGYCMPQKTDNTVSFPSRPIATLIAAAFIFPACSTQDIENRQQALSDVQANMIERREARQSARDERFRASRESWMD